MKKSALVLGLVLPALGVASTGGSLAPTERVSVSSSGAQGNLDSIHPSISADGRFVAFESMAATLVPGDVNGCLLPSGGWPCPDIFVRDRRTGLTTRVSVSSAGDEANEESHTPDISGDGRFVVFSSEASNLTPHDGNFEDIFIRDRDSDENGVFDEPGTATTTLVSMSADGGDADWGSIEPAISTDGRFIAFESLASNLVSNDPSDPRDTNQASDIFVRDRVNEATVLVSISSDGIQGNRISQNPAISADGRFVAFQSVASNLAPGDDNGMPDVFVHDRDADQDDVFDEPGAVKTVLVSRSTAGAVGNEWSLRPSISADGRFVAFESNAWNLAPGDTNECQGVFLSCKDIFVHDRDADEDGAFDDTGGVTTTRVSVSSAGVAGDDSSSEPSISADGRLVAFESMASNLAIGGTDSRLPDIYLHDRRTGLTLLASVSTLGVPAAMTSRRPALSADGRLLAFDSFAENLVPGDTNRYGDVFVHDLRGAMAPCGGIAATIVGTASADVLIGTAGPDVINPLGGDDLVLGLGGNDLICGGDGDDALFGGDGGDALLGEQGDDYLDGQGAADACIGGGHVVGDLSVHCEFIAEVP
jgi:Tol biopolymer transport system component